MIDVRRVEPLAAAAAARPVCFEVSAGRGIHNRARATKLVVYQVSGHERNSKFEVILLICLRYESSSPQRFVVPLQVEPEPAAVADKVQADRVALLRRGPLVPLVRALDRGRVVVQELEVG